MKCIHCGSSNDVGSKFCMICGKQIPQCPTCGRAITSRDAFCMYDGTPIPAEVLALIPEEIDAQVYQTPAAEFPEANVQNSMEPVVPVSYCMRCGLPVYSGADYCEICMAADAKQPTGYCMNCGQPNFNGEDYCDTCKATAPVANMDAVEPVAASKTKKKGGVIVVILLLLLLLVGTVGYLAIANEWIEAPEFLRFLQDDEDKREDKNKKDEDEDNGESTEGEGLEGEDSDNDPGTDQSTGENTEPSEAPTDAPVEEPTEEPTEDPTEEPIDPEDDPLLYFVENCDKMYFTEEDIAGFDEEMCRYARNACYAKSGRIFASADLQAYFSQFDWYEGTVSAENFHSGLLNQYQIANINLIMAYEAERGYN